MTAASGGEGVAQESIVGSLFEGHVNIVDKTIQPSSRIGVRQARRR